MCPKVIPDDVVNLMTMLYNYFARSPARKKAMREYIAVLNRDKNEASTTRPGVAVQNPVAELDHIMTILEERHKLPRRIVLTRWLSCAGAVRVILNCRDVYTNFFSNETTTGADDILELLEDAQ